MRRSLWCLVSSPWPPPLPARGLRDKISSCSFSRQARIRCSGGTAGSDSATGAATPATSFPSQSDNGSLISFISSAISQTPEPPGQGDQRLPLSHWLRERSGRRAAPSRNQAGRAPRNSGSLPAVKMNSSEILSRSPWAGSGGAARASDTRHHKEAPHRFLQTADE